MGRKLSMDDLAKYLAEQSSEIARLEKEVEEIQVGFNSAYVDFKARHDQTLAMLTDRLLAQDDGIDPALRARIEERRRTEQRLVEARRVALREKDLPAARKEADDKLALARRLVDERTRANPLLDAEEEKAKGRLAALKAELEGLNREIGKRRRGFGFLTNYGQIVKLDRRRNQAIGEIEATRKQVAEVRKEWQELVQGQESDQLRLQQEWQALTLRVAELQTELDQLDDDAQRELLIRRRAIFNTLDEATDPAICTRGALCEEIGEMVRLNIQTDNYQRGLGTVAGVIALLRGVQAGMGSFLSSVQAILEEQRMHSQYLKRPQVEVPDDVVTFHRQWEPLRKQVSDEARMARYPLEFVAAVEPALESGLSQPAIETMFKRLAAELQRATASWKG